MRNANAAVLVALAAALLTGPVKAAEISVAFTRPPRTTAALTGEVTFRFVPAAAGAAAIERRVDLASTSRFDVPRGHWRVEVDDSAWWHAPQYVFAGDAPSIVRVELWPAGSVTGSASIKGSRNAPSDVRLRLQSAAEPPELGSVEVRCDVAEGTFRCKVPVGRFDLRLRSPGFLPRYFWDTAVTSAAPRSLGSVVLEKGASLTGTVVTGRGVELDARERENIQVVARPASAELPVHAAALGRYVTKAAKRGHFNLDGLPPGEYVVQAAARKLLVSDEVHVVVVADMVAELNEPLRLEAPSTLRVAVTPPLDPWGERWRVTITRAASAGAAELAARTPMGENGEWISPPVRSGQYTVSIGSHEGGVWASEEVRLPDDPPLVQADLTAVKLKGRVTLGDRRLESAVRFDSGDDAESVEVTTDRDGQFETYLPRREGKTWRVTVKSDDPAVSHVFRNVEPERSADASEATVHLRVPLTTLSGFVLDEAGQPVDAIINVTSSTESLVQTPSRQDGFFAIYGLPPGSYSVQAAAFLAESDVVGVEITDDLAPDPVQLVVRGQRKVVGVIASDAAPVAGAEVLVVATDVVQHLIPSNMTNFRGEFAAVAPPGAREIDLLVGAPGFDFRMFHTQIAERPLQVRVTQQGGTIVIPAPVGDLQPYLQHAGAVHFAGGPTVHGLQVRTRDQQVVLSPMEPGPYSLCMIRHAEERALRAGLLDRRERCSEGFLPPYGELTFSPPRILSVR